MKINTLSNYDKKLLYNDFYIKRISFADDKITKLIWEDSKNTKLTQKSDDITNLAWSSTADYELVAQADYKPVAFAADLDEENNIQKQDEADKITRKIWAN